ncbi:MAG TPA: hypothetical protein VJZ71_19430 [Phycisphaerae bacterium]|nr:hypothetical protein [Phycisphaerae bacterium]
MPNRLLCLLVTLLSAPATLAARPLMDLVPADSLIVYAAKPYKRLLPTSRPDGQPTFSIASIAAALNAAGLIPNEGQVFADIAGALPLFGQFEHAVVLLEVSSRVVERKDLTASAPAELGPSLRLKSLQTAVIFRTGEQSSAVLQQLDRVIGRYTNQGVAQLTTQKEAGYSYQRLVDERLPGWAIWEWGRLDEFYVLSFGEGAFMKVAKTHAGQVQRLADDAWFRSALAKTHGDKALVHGFFALSRLREGLGDAAQGRVARVADALQASNMTHDLWTIGQEGRALTWYRCYHRDGEDFIRTYSEPASYPPHHRRIVPDTARHIAIINAPTRWLVDNLPRAWIAAQSEGNLRKWKRAWRTLEQETGIDIGGNLIEHLGQTIVIFDYPPHPLDIPFALTVAIEIKNQRAVRMATDALLGAWSQYLDDRAERNQTVLVRVKVKRDDDGIWYLQAGILGPALKVTDRYVVISWSPQALRDALKYIEAPTGKGLSSR